MKTKTMPNLSGFTGTEHYWRLWPGSQVALTDGARYLAEELEAYWLMEAIAYFLTSRKKLKGKYLVGIKLQVNSKNSAILTIEDDNEVFAKRIFKSTDFPAPGIELLAGSTGTKWVVMLLSEH